MLKLLVVLALLALAAFVVVRWSAPTPAGPPLEDFSLTPEEFSVRTLGWTRVELEAILARFAETYSLPANSLRPVDGLHGTFAIGSTHSLAWSHLLFLVNYLHYPVNFDLAGREVGAIATITLTKAMGAPAELAGRRATIYVPSNDTEHDLVYMRVEPAARFEMSFTELRPVAVTDGREPPTLSLLTRAGAADHRSAH